MKKYVCSICGYVYDESKGIPEAGIAPGTRWEDLPADWVCPICGATKAEFAVQGEAPAAKAAPAAAQAREAAGPDELNDLEKSALCSNLARGSEKQYLKTESELFAELSQYFKAIAAPAGEASLEELTQRIESDLAEAFPAANAASSADRGARRALVWSEKVTRILKSLLERYAREGEEMLRGVRVYVCTICGFVSLGEAPPALCPVCKAPEWKFEKVEGR